MVPDIATKGHSFKGAFAYYLHDKRQAGDGPHPATAERVAWTETRNLATDDPRAAKRIMVATAMQADELKAAAGIKSTGRKSTAHVYAYSLAWHPDEARTLDRAEMVRAADGSLKALGAGHLQAVIVCHTDRAHPHVHVIVNRVDPATGKMHAFSNDRFQLSDWANTYERERGKVLTPAREEKRQLREQFAQKAERRQYAEQRQQEAKAARKADGASAGAMLKEFQDQQKAQHRAEWRALADRNRQLRAELYADTGRQIKDAIARHKAETRPMWAAHFKEMRNEDRVFAKREGTISGVVLQAFAVARLQRQQDQLAGRGLLSATFRNVLSSQARAAAFETWKGGKRAELTGKLKAVLDAEVRAIKDKGAAALETQRRAHGGARAALIERQDGERAKIREAWKQHYSARGISDRFRDRDDAKPVLKMREKPAAVMEQKPMKRDFEKAGQIDPPPPRKGPTVPEYVARPSPAPTPTGDAPQPPKRVVEQVPAQVVQKPAPERAAKDWQAAAQPAVPARADALAERPQPPAKDWSTSAPPKGEDVAPRKDWAEVSKDKGPREIKPLPARDRSKDRDRER
jgi:hypothetical protein